MARRTNKERRALAAARAGEVTAEVVEAVTKKAEKVIKEAKKVVAPVVDSSPKPVVKKPARVVKKKVEEPKKNAEILGEDDKLADKTVVELRDIASEIDVDGRSKLTKKADIIEGIKSDDDWEK